MQEESACNQGPVFSSNMDVNLAKNRGLLQATSNADNKNVRESTKPKGNSRRRDYPRGGYDVNWLASSGGYGGCGGRRQRDHHANVARLLHHPNPCPLDLVPIHKLEEQENPR